MKGLAGPVSPGQDISALDLEDVLEQAAAVAADVCHARWAAIFLVSEESRVLHCVATHPAHRELPAEPLDSQMLWSRVVRRNQPETLNEPPGLSSTERSVLGAEKVEIAVGVPLVINGRSLGALVIGRPAGEPFDTEAQERADRQARGVAAAVERANLYQEATQRIAELSLLHEVGRAFNESLELSEILETCADQLLRLLDASNCFILLREGEGLRCVAASGLSPEHLPDIYILPDEPSVAAQSVRERRAIAVTDAERDGRANPRLTHLLGVKSVLAVPMLHRGRSIGALIFNDNRARRLFTPAEIERAGLVASRLAAAVDNARLYEDLRRSYADLAEAQARLVQRERLAALGELAAQVAHEVRNPLGAVFNVAAELERRFGHEGEVGFLLGVLSEEAQRINRIVGDLLDFARPLELNLISGGLRAVLQDVEQAVLHGTQVTCDRDYGEGLDQVSLDPRLMRQALLNLFENAIQALSGRGRVRIAAHVIDVSGRAFSEVVLEDSGPGVETSMQQRIFEPFFTTKAAGIGLGLAVVKRIAEAHQGEATVRSSSLGGAAFVLRWPLQVRGEA
jgi:signal transduction histidine kinase